MTRTLTQGAIIAAMLWLATSDFANSRLPGSSEPGLEPAAGTWRATSNAALPAPNPATFFFKNAQPAAKATTAPKPRLTERALRVRKGDTLMNLLLHADVPRGEAHLAIEALSKSYDPRKLKPGTEIVLRYLSAPAHEKSAKKTAASETFDGIRVPLRYDQDIVVARNNAGKFIPKTVEKRVLNELVHTGAQIKTSLFEAADRADIPTNVIVELIHAYSFDIDFQREIRSGDKFEMMYERFLDEEGQVVHNGNLLYARLVIRGKPLKIYRFSPQKGVVDYFNAKGQSVRKALMRTPVDGARISSHFGKRRHPILGYTRMHRGVDFAAPRGTPVLASGNGIIERANRYGGYGKYIRIRHNSRFKTAYAHLKGFAKGIRKGKRVKQGQVIGYVGTTGRSTGPHLHYEVHEHNRQMNPMRLNLPSGLKLGGEALASFEKSRSEVDRLAADLPLQSLLASNK